LSNFDGKFGVADFADWTWEEFKNHRLGAAQNCSATLKGNHKMTDANLPEEVYLQLLL
jgi:cathepsin H